MMLLKNIALIMLHLLFIDSDAIISRNNECYSLRCDNIMVLVAAILWVNRQPKLLSNISPTVSSLDPPQHTRRRGTVTLRGNDTSNGATDSDLRSLLHNHAGGRFIGKLGVELKAKFCEKLDRLLEIFDG